MKSPRVTLDQWRVLQTVVDEGGFAQAADALHRSQSSVSYAIKGLQDQLGVPVLLIHGRRAVLTEVGTVLLSRARQLLNDAAALESLAASLQQGWEAELHLIVDAVFPSATLVAVLKEFAPESRGTRIQLREVVLSGADDALASGEADLVIGYRVPPGFLGDTLLDVEFIAVAHPTHALHQLGRPLVMEDLVRAQQVVLRDSGAHNIDKGWLGALHRWTLTSIETSVTTISNGIGFGWLPRHRIEDKIAQGLLKPLPLREGQTRREMLYLVFGKPDAPGPATQRLASLFRQHCAALTRV